MNLFYMCTHLFEIIQQHSSGNGQLNSKLSNLTQLIPFFVVLFDITTVLEIIQEMIFFLFVFLFCFCLFFVFSD